MGPWLVVVVLFVAGCVVPQENGLELEGQVQPGFELVGRDCIEAGGQSVAPRSIAGMTPFMYPQAPWERADVLEDTGPQLVYSQGVTDPLNPVPREGHTWGHIHVTLWCESWTFNDDPRPGLVFGYVGAKVEEPPFGDDVPSRSYLTTLVAVNDPEIRQALQSIGVEAMDATATMDFDGTRLHTVLETHHHGTYETLFLVKELGKMPEEPFRLWWQVDNGDETAVPVALDLSHTPGAVHYGAEGQSYFAHTGTHMHGPQGGLAANTAAVAWVGHDRTIVFGPRADDVLLPEIYYH
jgi:hypothetical protein